MRVVKAVLALSLIAALAGMWFNRSFVVAAYTETDDEPVSVRLSGLDLTIEPSDLGPSPYHIAFAPDTADNELALTPDDGPAPPEPKVKLTGGHARLRGDVRGPDGIVGAATVRVERHSDDGIAFMDLQTDAQGRWSIDGLLGGRYRVRAWQVGRSTATESHVLFVDDWSRTEVDLTVWEVDPSPAMSFSDAGPIYAGLTGTVAVSVTTSVVDDDGIVEIAGLPGAVVALAPTAGVSISPAVAVADTDGVARFVVTCDGLGSPSAVATHQGLSTRFDLPACVPQPLPPPPPAPEPAPAPAATEDA